LPAVPIVLGVVGHRDVRPGDREVLKQTVKDILEEFQKAFLHTPLVMLSALAEGADQLAAEAALECKTPVFVRAPLPFPPASYRPSTSFDSEDSRQLLDNLLANEGFEWFVVPLPADQTDQGEPDWLRVATDKSDEPAKRLRHTCYANAGGYIVRRCDVLIAFWNGEEKDTGRGPSGTREFVDFKLHGRAPSLYPWTFAEPLGFRTERGLVVAVHTPRVSTSPGSPDTARPPGELRVFVPSDGQELWSAPPEELPLARRISRGSRFFARVMSSLAWLVGSSARGRPERQRRQTIKQELRQFREMCTTIDDFNRDLGGPRVAAAIRDRLKDESRLLAPGFDEQHNAWLRRLGQIREAAAELTTQLQPRLNQALAAVFILLGLSVFAFHFYAHWFDYDRQVEHAQHQPVGLLFFLILLTAAAGVVIWDWWTRLDERRLDSRGLAEALRVRRAWALAGLERSVADSYLGQLRGEMSWVRQALLHSCPPPKVWGEQFSRLRPAQKLALLDKVRKEWVRGQVSQFEESHRKEHSAAARLRRIGFALALSGWGLLIWLLLAAEHRRPTPAGPAPAADGRAAPAKAGAQPGPTPPARARSAAAHPPMTASYPRHWILLLASSLVITGGLCIAYCERRAHEDLSKQYERMRIVFSDGDRELAARLASGDIAGAQRVIEKLGQEAIVEHSQWLVLRRARPLELHIGG
jgi:hypothetical protein